MNYLNGTNANIEVIYEDTNEFIENEEIKNNVWKLEIPKIELSAQIEEGTTNEILNQYIGHFENTSKQNRKCITCCT